MDYHKIASNLLNQIAVVRTNPLKFFFYVPIPQEIQDKCSQINLGLSDISPEINDHLTLLYVNDEFSNSAQMLPFLKSRCFDLTKSHGALHAKLQGWAYFDGAEKDGEKCTALVALVDVPGLEDLHVDLKRMVRSLGINAPQNHGFNCHTTFAYLPLGTRLSELPVLDDEFAITKFCLSNDQVYEFDLSA
jgi:hypothetical protein